MVVAVVMVVVAMILALFIDPGISRPHAFMPRISAAASGSPE